jgi:hypothetical protein
VIGTSLRYYYCYCIIYFQLVKCFFLSIFCPSHFQSSFPISALNSSHASILVSKYFNRLWTSTLPAMFVPTYFHFRLLLVFLLSYSLTLLLPSSFFSYSTIVSTHFRLHLLLLPCFTSSYYCPYAPTFPVLFFPLN